MSKLIQKTYDMIAIGSVIEPLNQYKITTNKYNG